MQQTEIPIAGEAVTTSFDRFQDALGVLAAAEKAEADAVTRVLFLRTTRQRARSIVDGLLADGLRPRSPIEAAAATNGDHAPPVITSTPPVVADPATPPEPAAEPAKRKRGRPKKDATPLPNDPKPDAEPAPPTAETPQPVPMPAPKIHPDGCMCTACETKREAEATPQQPPALQTAQAAAEPAANAYYPDGWPITLWPELKPGALFGAYIAGAVQGAKKPLTKPAKVAAVDFDGALWVSIGSSSGTNGCWWDMLRLMPKNQGPTAYPYKFELGEWPDDAEAQRQRYSGLVVDVGGVECVVMPAEFGRKLVHNAKPTAAK
jgi:outer membrane biosynthesis protein TonB